MSWYLIRRHSCAHDPDAPWHLPRGTTAGMRRRKCTSGGGIEPASVIHCVGQDGLQESRSLRTTATGGTFGIIGQESPIQYRIPLDIRIDAISDIEMCTSVETATVYSQCSNRYFNCITVHRHISKRTCTSTLMVELLFSCVTTTQNFFYLMFDNNG